MGGNTTVNHFRILDQFRVDGPKRAFRVLILDRPFFENTTAHVQRLLADGREVPFTLSLNLVKTWVNIEDFGEIKDSEVVFVE